MRDSAPRASRIPLVCPPPRLAADTPAKRIADRLLPKGLGQCIFFAAVAIGVWAPGLPTQPAVAVSLVATVAASSWCLVNFWRCREAHCVVSGIGWAALAVVEIVELALNRSFLFGDEGLVFIAILVVALVFEGFWHARHGTNALVSNR